MHTDETHTSYRHAPLLEGTNWASSFGMWRANSFAYNLLPVLRTMESTRHHAPTFSVAHAKGE